MQSLNTLLSVYILYFIVQDSIRHYDFNNFAFFLAEKMLSDK